MERSRDRSDTTIPRDSLRDGLKFWKYFAQLYCRSSRACLNISSYNPDVFHSLSKTYGIASPPLCSSAASLTGYLFYFQLRSHLNWRTLLYPVAKLHPGEKVSFHENASCLIRLLNLTKIKRADAIHDALICTFFGLRTFQQAHRSLSIIPFSHLGKQQEIFLAIYYFT